MSWFALYTKPRNEKKVVEGLQQLGIEVYCPMVTQIKQWSDRKKKVEVPLIPSYVFVKVTEKERPLVFQVFGVVRYLFWLGKPAVILEEEIAVLKNTLQDTFTEIETTAIPPGASLTIPSGPFKGKEGVVTVAQGNKIQLILKELGCMITLTK
jgi:transcriptional antiterminator RfaH